MTVSAKNRVNKDHYTQAGRDRANENIVHDEQKEALTRTQKRIATGEAAAPRGNHPSVEPAKDTLPSDRLPLKARAVGGEEHGKSDNDEE
jgi:hypothetical protein